MTEYIYGSIKCERIPEYRLERREEIVRCRDCAYICHNEYENGCEYLTCGFFDNRYAEVEPDGFCAWGERRES